MNTKAPDPQCEKCNGRGYFNMDVIRLATTGGEPINTCPCTKKKPSEVIRENIEKQFNAAGDRTYPEVMTDCILEYLDTL